MMAVEGPVLLFDGYCNLCSRCVQFVLKRNSKGNVRFASLQSELGMETLRNSGLPTDYTSSLVLLENDAIHVRSDAALRLSGHLDGLWRSGSALLIVPKFIRDPVYDLIARNRYRWFGKKETC